ncbi:hypothetical protein HPB50_008388 [Hyalomma asiaticum]|uniref:Uncharacterized protein n=1 Tax=Hyalomma asiaticum TaxID=266040 RepID=A0ACB7RKW9_HYAAI|nr:hypothetical protein HPB50_008388 [Hyalomma asiaticum]
MSGSAVCCKGNGDDLRWRRNFHGTRSGRDDEGFNGSWAKEKIWNANCGLVDDGGMVATVLYQSGESLDLLLEARPPVFELRQQNGRCRCHSTSC